MGGRRPARRCHDIAGKQEGEWIHTFADGRVRSECHYDAGELRTLSTTRPWTVPALAEHFDGLHRTPSIEAMARVRHAR